MTRDEPTDRLDAPFENDVASVLTRLRSGLAEVIAAVPDQVTKGADLHRALRIDRKLSWKVFKVATATDPISSGPHVPSPANLATFFRAATKKGVPSTLIDRASRVAAEFEEVVNSHAGDRATFDSMVSALGSEETAGQLDLVHRRLAFRGQRHILGVQARTQLKFVAIQPSANPTLLDGARVEGFVGLRRLRYSAPLVISHSGARNDDGSPLEIKREPLEPVTGAHGLSLLQQFCTKPLPEFRAGNASHGFVDGELVGCDVGNRAAITCVEGHVTREALPRYAVDGNRLCGTVVTVRTPCEVVILDFLVREDTYGPIQPSAFAHAEHLGDMLWDGVIRERHRLPIHEAVAYLGKGASVLHTPDVPRYAEIGRYVFDRLGWDGDRFNVYRCRVEYPVMPSSIVIRFALPDAPQV